MSSLEGLDTVPKKRLGGSGMGSEWKVAKLGTLGVLDRGKSKHRPRYAEHLYGGPYPFVQTGDITASGGRITTYKQTYSEDGLRQSRLWDTGTLCITIAANIAETALLTFPACFPDSVVGFIADRSKCDVRFVEYWFRSMRAAIKSRAHGTVQDNINLQILRDLDVFLPSLEDQIEIADTLSALDDKIALLRETNATLEAIAQALFKSWFVDFDPVRAKAEGRDPEGVPPEVADLFPSEFEDSELGAIPKGWRARTFEDLADVSGGSTPSTKEPRFWEEGIHHWATPKDLSALDTPVLLETERRITDAGLEKISSGLLPVGTVLLSSRAPIGYLVVAEVPVAVNQGFVALKPRQGVSNLYLLRLVEARMDDIKSRANGSTFLEISKGNFRPIPVLAPPESVMAAFEKIVRPLYERLVVNQRERSALASMRDTLLPRLMSGKLRIHEVPV